MDKEKNFEEKDVKNEPEKKITQKFEIKKTVSKRKFTVARVRDGFLTLRDSRGNGSKIPQTKEYMDAKRGDIIEL
jgi:hypothetical protein